MLLTHMTKSLLYHSHRLATFKDNPFKRNDHSQKTHLNSRLGPEYMYLYLHTFPS